MIVTWILNPKYWLCQVWSSLCVSSNGSLCRRLTCLQRSVMRWDIQSDVNQRGEMYKIRWVSTFGKLLWVIFWIWWIGIFYILKIIAIGYNGCNPCLIFCMEIIIPCLFLAYMKKEAFKWLSISKGKSVLTAVIYKSHWGCNIPCLLFICLLRSDWNKLIMLLP